MIDMASRAKARKIIERVLSHGLHAEDVECDWPRTEDTAVRSIGFWLWTLYDDDCVGVAQFPADSEEAAILRNAQSFLDTSANLEMRKRGLLAPARHVLAAGVEWRDCELPWHNRWPFPPGA